MAKKVDRFGGSFAPPLTDELLAAYRTLIDSVPTATTLRDALETLYNCAKQWWEQPESTGGGKPHPCGRGVIVDLDEEIADALERHIPWDHELKAFAEEFEKIDNSTQKELRDAAHHLLWHGWELFLDREPITSDKL